MTLITGPLASGKSTLLVAEFRRELLRNPAHVRLIVPTATMAEHLRNQLARDGLTFPPAAISTFSKFLEPYLPPAPPGPLRVYIQRALDASPQFATVRDFPGFIRSLQHLLEELDAARIPDSRLEPAILSIRQHITAQGWTWHGHRLSAAAQRIQTAGAAPITRLFFDGFFSFTQAELEVIRALSTQANLTITLPHSDGAAYFATRDALLSAGFAEQRLTAPQPTPTATIIEAPSDAQEAEEIARRILALRLAGHPFRNIGVVVRSEQPYIPLLRATFERFSIPARFYFGQPLHQHPVIRFLLSALNLIQSGWCIEGVLPLIQHAGAGFPSPAADRLDFDLRKLLPAHGRAALNTLGSPSFQRFLDSLAPLMEWAGQRATPAEWARRFERLAALYRPPQPQDNISHSAALLLRSEAAAIPAFLRAAEEAASTCPLDPTTLGAFCSTLETVLAESTLRIPDRRRDVVHVLDVYEARQWRLPFVFLCGLTEGVFPRQVREDSLCPDADRRSLGLPLTADRYAEEEFLFSLAVTRAERELFLSYPAFDAAGNPRLRSFALDRFAAARNLQAPVPSENVRPIATRPAPLTHTPRIAAADLQAALAMRHEKLKPTGIESFLQCPFQFFANQSLRLETAPPLPQERLDFLLQGTIVHEVLASALDAPLLANAEFERLFEEYCERFRIPPGYRTATIHLDMWQNLQRLFRSGLLPGMTTEAVEQDFEIDLAPGIRLRGKIDRIMRVPSIGGRVVIDFKYSAAHRVKNMVARTRDGELVQAGLYLTAARQLYKRHPVGMFYCGLKKEVVWAGWHAGVPGWERFGDRTTADALRDIEQQARDLAIDVHRRLLEGHIAPDPADPDKCRYCDYHDICRIETAQPKVATA